MSFEETFAKLNGGINDADALNVLAKCILGEDWYSDYWNPEDVNADITISILKKYSWKFRRKYKKWLKKK